MTTLATIDGREIRGWVFTCLDFAQSFAFNATEPLWVMLGDHPQYWIVTPADAARLERAGYEYAC